MKTDIKQLKKSVLIKSFVVRFLLFSAGWIVLLGGQRPSEFWLVVLFLTSTTVISIYSIPPGKWVLRPLGTIRFFFYFIKTAVKGGWDVGKRVFLKRVPTDPEFIAVNHYRDPLKTLILAWVISLQPGTTSCMIKKKKIVIHVLDKKIPVAKEIITLQRRIDDMFAEG